MPAAASPTPMKSIAAVLAVLLSHPRSPGNFRMAGSGAHFQTRAPARRSAAFRPSLPLLLAIAGLALARADGGAALSSRELPDVAFLAPDRKEKLDLYLPTEPAAGTGSPAVVWIHGGGWLNGTKAEARAQAICRTLADAGYVAASIDYRLGPGAWPGNLFDCKNAVRFLRAHATRYRIDPDRIAVAGGSAGGHLALMVALTAGAPDLEPTGAQTPYPQFASDVRCVINFYGITDLLVHGQTDAAGQPTATRKLVAKTLSCFGAADDEADVLRVASPITYVKPSSPPILSFHGRADTTVDFSQAVTLDQVAKARGAAHTLLLLDGVGHTFDLQTWSKQPLPLDLRPVFLTFLAKNLK